jgi:hypothetical protein
MDDFNVGDHVEWNSEAGHVRGIDWRLESSPECRGRQRKQSRGILRKMFRGLASTRSRLDG